MREIILEDLDEVTVIAENRISRAKQFNESVDCMLNSTISWMIEQGGIDLLNIDVDDPDTIKGLKMLKQAKDMLDLSKEILVDNTTVLSEIEVNLARIKLEMVERDEAINKKLDKILDKLNKKED